MIHKEDLYGWQSDSIAIFHQVEESSGSFTASQDEEPTEVTNVHTSRIRNWSGHSARSESLSLLMLHLCLCKSSADFLEECQSSPTLPKPKAAGLMTGDLDWWCGTFLYLSLGFHCYYATKVRLINKVRIIGRLILSVTLLVLWVEFGLSISYLQELGLQSWGKLPSVHGSITCSLSASFLVDVG